ncbi:hypothetical protein TRFO_27354 [Tritrichomonas foetus]|uniref:KEN domain-containing protein n=1 Tax=Tritrichomonas foetus TaxID=1144522 RepID=A0A1J4K0S9_9EUKA|nr:hypothetical protein TRFO_27354 [Tritrichomonas foetus]|eukprot:OHT05033.1 hypothetical protein TRFO_27354 [Tritrichomonas foetus]
MFWFLFFPFFTQSVKKEKTSAQKIRTEWYAETRDRHIYVGTSNGLVHFVNIFTGNVDFSIDTGGYLFNSTTSGSYTFLPSIDGFLLSYNDTKIKRFPQPIRNFEPQTSNGEITISSTNKSVSYVVNEKDGNILINKNNNGILPAGYTRIVRTDYSLKINDSTATLRYSDFNITNNIQQIIYPQEVKVLTSFHGDIILMVNNSKKIKQKINGIPIVVFGTGGLFNFQSHSSLSVASDQVILIRKASNAFALPPVPFDGNGNLPQKKIFSNTKNNIENNVDFLPNPPLLFQSKMEFTFPAEINPRITNQKNFISLNQPTKNVSAPIILPFFIFLTSAMVIIISFQFYVLKKRKAESIQIDPNDPSIGTCEHTKCRIVKTTTFDQDLFKQLGNLNLNIQSIEIPKRIELVDNEYFIAYELHEQLDFISPDFNASHFLTEMLKILNILHQNNIVHGAISEKAFFKRINPFNKNNSNSTNLRNTDNLSNSSSKVDAIVNLKMNELVSSSDQSNKYENSYLIGHFEQAHFSESKIEFIADFESLKYIVSKYVDSSDPVLHHFLHHTNRMEYQELIRHPLYQSNLEKIKVIIDACEKLNQLKSKSSISKEFEKGKNQIFDDKWSKCIPKEFLNSASKNRWYNTKNLKDLIALIRNKWVHKDLDDNPKFQCIYGDGSPDFYFSYFNKKYPNLFMYVYDFLMKQV